MNQIIALKKDKDRSDSSINSTLEQIKILVFIRIFDLLPLFLLIFLTAFFTALETTSREVNSVLTTIQTTISIVIAIGYFFIGFLQSKLETSSIFHGFELPSNWKIVRGISNGFSYLVCTAIFSIFNPTNISDLESASIYFRAIPVAIVLVFVSQGVQSYYLRSKHSVKALTLLFIAKSVSFLLCFLIIGYKTLAWPENIDGSLLGLIPPIALMAVISCEVIFLKVPEGIDRTNTRI